MKNTFWKKLTSRKFIVTAISAIAGIVTIFVGDNAVVDIIASALMIVVPTIVYCVTEGVIDSKSIKVIAETTAEAAEKLGADDKIVDAIEQVGEIGEILTDNNTEE